MSSFPYTLKRVERAVKLKAYRWFEGEYDLNLVGIRTNDDSANTFNDWFTVSHRRPSGVWAFYAFQCTTDPGLYWRKNPMNVNGTAILKPGQIRSMWKLGKHQGRYRALVQQTECTVLRDPDGDEVLDGQVEGTGFFGINCHRANAKRASSQVDKWSAGCQVLADPDDFAFLLTLCDRQVERHGWKTFTYTLLTEDDF